jgi:hypothetical protein
MKDARLIAAFAVVGLVIAWFASAPLRRGPDQVTAPAEQTARLQDQAPPAQVYAAGTVEAAPGLTSRAPALFIIARPASGGMPVAVKRIPEPVFPVAFSLTMADSMAGGDYYGGDLTIIARLDADGSAGPVQPGDIESSAPLKAGEDRHVRLVLSPSPS